MSEKELSTRLIHTGDGQDYRKLSSYQSMPEVFPVYLTSVFSFNDVPSLDAIYEGKSEGYVYTRMRHPNTDAVGRILAAAEGGGEGLVFSSGMAAIVTSILSQVGAGDHVVASPILYGGVRDFLEHELPRLGASVTFVDFVHGDIESAIQKNTKLLYTETLSNPLLEVPDLRNVADIAHAHGLKLFVDNTFATAAIVQPLLLGADLVLYSATKYLGGHSDIVAGAAVGSPEVIGEVRKKQGLYGPILDPWSSWLLARSLRTLDLRVRKHSENALKVAQFLANHPNVDKVYYPGLPTSPDHERAAAQFRHGLFGGMLSFDLKGGEKEASQFIQILPTIKFVPSLAGTATTLSYAVKTSHRAYTRKELDEAGITYGQLRLSVGLEDAEDIIKELQAALEKLDGI